MTGSLKFKSRNSKQNKQRNDKNMIIQSVYEPMKLLLLAVKKKILNNLKTSINFCKHVLRSGRQFILRILFCGWRVSDMRGYMPDCADSGFFYGPPHHFANLQHFRGFQKIFWLSCIRANPHHMAWSLILLPNGVQGLEYIKVNNVLRNRLIHVFEMKIIHYCQNYRNLVLQNNISMPGISL